MLVHVVSDYGPACDLAFEVVQRIRLHLPDAEPVLVPVPPFATLAAGFCLGQLALNEAPPGALRSGDAPPRSGAEGPRRPRGSPTGGPQGRPGTSGARRTRASGWPSRGCARACGW